MVEKPSENLLKVILIISFLIMVPGGYQLTVLNAPQALLESFVNSSHIHEYGYQLSDSSHTILWSFIVACQAIGALSGCFLSVPIAEFNGVKSGLLVYNNLFLLIGSLFFAIAKSVNSFECLIVGRLVLGIYTGCGMALSAAFIQDCSPPELRGMLSCTLHVFTMLGGALGAILGLENVLGTEEGWPFLLSLPAVFSVLQLFCYPFVKESPKYLHEQHPFSNEALESVQFYYGPDVVPAKILFQFDAEKAETGAEMSFWEAWREEKSRNRILLGALVNFAQILTGLMAITSYSTTILTQLGVSLNVAQYGTAAGAFFGLFFSIPTFLYIEKLGRRKLLLSSLTAITGVLVALVLFGVLTEKGIGGRFSAAMLLLAMILFLIAYNFGPGPIAYFISGELAPANCRTSFLAFGVSVNWLSTTVSTFIFYPLSSAVGQFSFLLFLIPTAISTLLLYLYLPETKTSTTDILDEGFKFLSAQSQEALHELDPTFETNTTKTSSYDPLIRERSFYGSFASDSLGFQQ